MSDPATLPAWHELTALAQRLAGERVDTWFEQEAARAQRFSLSAAGLWLDYSKQRINAEVMSALVDLAEQQGLAARRGALFDGEPVNSSEDRAAWHTALRAPRHPPADTPGTPEVHAVLDAMRDFVADVRGGAWLGYTGRAITDVVNIGIGGSDLGPRLVCEVLADRNTLPRAHFVANVDPADLDDTLAGLDPATTLFIVASKSFTTAETLANARAARRWLFDAGASEADVGRHFVAVSTNDEAVKAFGIERIFGFWDWVGGRVSLWSAVGLPIALTLGMAVFDELLAGAHAMDRHFRQAPPAQNLPVILALVGIWNRNFVGLPSHVVVPYAQRMAAFPGWLQQLEMESNGKSVTRAGEDVTVDTVPAIWGGVGTNAQHAFFQMLHQGAPAADVDFILPLRGESTADDERERQRVTNCLAQAEALMRGRDPEALDAHLRQEGYGAEQRPALAMARRFDGNRPSSTLVFDALDARHLGALLAAYEHKVFVQGVVWGINSFDQWGVELGKTMAGQLERELSDPAASRKGHDGSTEALLAQLRRVWEPR